MPVGSVVVRVRPGSVNAVRSTLEALGGVAIVDQQGDGLAVLVEAPTARQQRALHEQIVRLTDVDEALLVLQSSEV